MLARGLRNFSWFSLAIISVIIILPWIEACFGSFCLVGSYTFDKILLPLSISIISVIGLLAVFREGHNHITKQTYMEAQLKASEEQYRSLYQNAQVGLCTTTLKGEHILMVNPKTAQMFGYDCPEELLGRPASCLWAEPEKRVYLLEKVKTEKVVSGYIFNGICKDGTIKQFEICCRYNPEADYIESNLIDVSENRQAKEKIQYQSYLLENIQESIVVIDTNKCITYVNQRAGQLFNINFQDRLDVHLCRIMKPYDPEKIQSIQKQIFSGQSWQGQISLLVDSKIKHFRHHIDPLQMDNKIIGIVIISTDISDLIEAREIAETANMAKSQFLANMSHEIRTPMIGILGSVDLLANSLQCEQMDYLATIRECGEHLLETINQILDVSKIELGIIDLNQETVDLNELLRKTASIVEPSLRAKGLELELVLNENNQLILVDPLKLRQVLLNLLYNAVKFTTRGKILVQAELSTNQAGNTWLSISVTDTGIGISPDKIGSIFEPFTQVDNSTSREFGGTGLGLFVCKKLVELMQGTLEVERLDGQGSRFHFCIPVQTEVPVEYTMESTGVEEKPIYKDDLILDFTPVSILVVEDNELNQKIVSKMLQNYGFEVSTVGNGLECLNILQHSNFDMILMDMQMPVMDGYEATRSIRLNSAWPDIPIIAMTAHAMNGDREKCLAYGCNAYMAKPFKAEDLIMEIKKYLNISRINSKKVYPGNQLISDLLPEFMDLLEEMLNSLATAIDEKNMGAIKSISHDIKGTAGMYGFMNISETAASIENLARENKYQRIPLMSQKLYALYEDVNSEVS